MINAGNIRSFFQQLGDMAIALLAAVALGGITSMLTNRNITIALYVFAASLFCFVLVFMFDFFRSARFVARIAGVVILLMFLLLFGVLTQ